MNPDELSRLADQADLPSDVRMVLESADLDAPSASDLAAMSAHIGLATNATVAASGAGAGSGSLARWIAIKAIAVRGLAGLLLISGIGTGIVLVTRNNGPHGENRVQIGATSMPFVAPTNPPPILPIAPIEAIASPRTPQPEVTRAPEPSEAPRHATNVSNSTTFTETEILDQAAEAMRQGGPARALILTARCAAAFPNGALSEERERIAIEALTRMGNVAQARTKARHFRLRYPDSTYNRRLDVLLATPNSGQNTR